jgi:ApaG protein
VLKTQTLPILELPGLWVSVDRVEFNPHVQVTPDRPYAFVYYITIHNDSTRTVTIRGRKWIVTDREGRKSILEGDGVVGEFPVLRPGEQYHYNSYHLIANDSVAEGAYLAQDEQQNRVLTRIPRFTMQIPLV